MIRYLHNASNDIEYTNANGETITRNPFDKDFVLISQRLSLQYSNAAENRRRREQYEREVRNVNVSIDAGRPADLSVLKPLQIITPDDIDLPVSETVLWDPPLAELHTLTPNTSHGFGPTARLDAVRLTDKEFDDLLDLLEKRKSDREKFAHAPQVLSEPERDTGDHVTGDHVTGDHVTDDLD